MQNLNPQEDKTVKNTAIFLAVLIVSAILFFFVGTFITINNNLEVEKVEIVKVKSVFTTDKQEQYIITQADTLKVIPLKEIQAKVSTLQKDSLYILSLNKKGEVFKVE